MGAFFTKDKTGTEQEALLKAAQKKVIKDVKTEYLLEQSRVNVETVGAELTTFETDLETTIITPAVAKERLDSILYIANQAIAQLNELNSRQALPKQFPTLNPTIAGTIAGRQATLSAHLDRIPNIEAAIKKKTKSRADLEAQIATPESRPTFATYGGVFDPPDLDSENPYAWAGGPLRGLLFLSSGLSVKGSSRNQIIYDYSRTLLVDLNTFAGVLLVVTLFARFYSTAMVDKIPTDADGGRFIPVPLLEVYVKNIQLAGPELAAITGSLLFITWAFIAAHSEKLPQKMYDAFQQLRDFNTEFTSVNSWKNFAAKVGLRLADVVGAVALIDQLTINIKPTAEDQRDISWQGLLALTVLLPFLVSIGVYLALRVVMIIGHFLGITYDGSKRFNFHSGKIEASNNAMRITSPVPINAEASTASPLISAATNAADSSINGAEATSGAGVGDNAGAAVATGMVDDSGSVTSVASELSARSVAQLKSFPPPIDDEPICGCWPRAR